MNIVDAVIIVCFIVGIMWGMRKGAVTSIFSLIGIVLIFILSFYLKNPLAAFFYKNLPFFNFGGFLKGVVVVNILLYEFIAFIFCMSVLSLVLTFILKITGILEKIFKATIILGLISKLIGAVIGFATSYVILFVLLFITNQPFFNVTGLNDSELSAYILNNTPVLSGMTEGVTKTIDEIYNINKNYSSLSKNDFNYKTLDTMLKNKVITYESAIILLDKGKLTVSNADNLIEKYKEE